MLGEAVSVDVKLPEAPDAEVRIRGVEDELDNTVDWGNVPEEAVAKLPVALLREDEVARYVLDDIDAAVVDVDPGRPARTT